MKHSPHPALWLACSLGAYSLFACEPRLVVGERTCVAVRDAGADSAVPNLLDPVTLPWSTSFEQGTCDYASVAGFCYANGGASYTFVTSPVPHTGKFAAAFQVQGDSTQNPGQARCVRQGELPTDAYYSAWYFVPSTATNTGNWNLFHFQGGQPRATHGLWDVSLSSAANGELSLYVYDALDSGMHGIGESPPIPIGAWFQIEVYLHRATDATGQFTVYQDGQRIIDVTNIRTDDTTWGQWYVGNYATALMPADSTLYVDDVMLRATQ